MKTTTTTAFEKSYPVFMAKKFTDSTFLLLQKRKPEELAPIDKMMIHAEVLRKKWKADYDDRNQEKHFGWLLKTASGWVFNDALCVLTGTDSSVGPRFVFRDAKTAKKFVTDMFPIIIEHLTIN